MNIAVVGTGYVGLVSGTCLADIGHKIYCIDIDADKIERLKQGIIPIYEPGLDVMVKHNQAAGRLFFSTSLKDVLPEVQAIFIAVGTPSAKDGKADLQYVFAVAQEIADNIKDYKLVVDKSTVPPGTGREVEKIIKAKYSGEFDVASCPEFLREGSAIEDFARPDRVVIGTRTKKAADLMTEIFAPVKGEKLITSVESAELIKYSSNAFLATKISFINEIAQICEKIGADIEEVAYGMGLDTRIGPKFLKAGIGWGGSCFPKDVTALTQIAGAHNYDFKLLKAVIEVNQYQRKFFVDKVKEQLGDLAGKKLGVLGLAFKADTDDIRESAGIDIIKLLVTAGAKICAFDYQATENAKKILGTSIEYATTPEAVAEQSDALLIVTEWKEFKDLDWQVIKNKLNQPLLLDGRNLLDPKKMLELGFNYHCIGRNI